ncbi:MAG TPA: ferric reductase-like transmembrane domain-containing protein [Candidatus Saccharimonadales bacterium]|jgi:sulfoxide reductase heme-binding subunit YedZ
MDSLRNTLRYYGRGIRLYLSIGIVLLTLEVLWWGIAVYGATDLATIRIQEAYAWLSVALLVLALLIGPITKVFPKLPGMPMIRESRRIIGIGAAWFAVLHALLSYFKQFNADSIFGLPAIYQQSFALGILAIIALLALTFTSANAIMRAMGVWWFRLHRLIYVAILASLMHAFMIGAHATSLPVLVALAALAAIWIGCNIYLLFRDKDASFWRILALCIGTILLLATLNYGLTEYRGNNLIIGEHGEHE